MPRVVSTRPAGEWRSSYAEFRHARHRPSHTLLGLDDPVFGDSERRLTFWKYVTAPPLTAGDDARVFLSREEQRTLSKASASAGGYLVPTDFDSQVTTLRRRGAVIGTL